MAEYEQRDNSGSLFKNDEKGPENPTWADYRGSIMIDGTEYWLSAWIKKAKSGQTFMSLAVKPKETRKQETRAPRRGRDEEESDLPF